MNDNEIIEQFQKIFRDRDELFTNCLTAILKTTNHS